MSEKKRKKRVKKRRNDPPDMTTLEKKLKKSKGIGLYDHGKAKLSFKSKKEARRQALVDYVTDHEERSIDATYHRADRNYSELITLTRWREWASIDGWVGWRNTFWRETQVKLIRKMEDRMVDLHMQDIDLLHEIQRPMVKWLMPLTDADGNEILDENGLPKYPLELGRIDTLAKVWLALLEKKTALRGDVLHRTDVIARAHKEEGKESTSETAGPSRFSPHEYENISKMARHILALRDPKLNRVIEVDDDGDGEEDS